MLSYNNAGLREGLSSGGPKANTPISHGGGGGMAHELTLSQREYLTSVILHSGQYKGRTRVSFARFTTNTGRPLFGGSETSNAVTYTAPAGWQIAGFHGRSWNEVDSLGAISTKVS